MTSREKLLEPFVRQRAALLTTYRRDGTPVGTAVNIAVDGDRAFVRTPHRTGKVKRLRNNPNVQIAPCTYLGKPTGPAISAQDDALRSGAGGVITGQPPVVGLPHSAQSVSLDCPFPRGLVVMNL